MPWPSRTPSSIKYKVPWGTSNPMALSWSWIIEFLETLISPDAQATSRPIKTKFLEMRPKCQKFFQSFLSYFNVQLRLRLTLLFKGIQAGPALVLLPLPALTLHCATHCGWPPCHNLKNLKASKCPVSWCIFSKLERLVLIRYILGK